MHAILPRKLMKPLQTRGTLGVTIGCLQLICSYPARRLLCSSSFTWYKIATLGNKGRTRTRKKRLTSFKGYNFFVFSWPSLFVTSTAVLHHDFDELQTDYLSVSKDWFPWVCGKTRPDSKRGFLYTYLFSFPWFWTLCIEWFAFQFYFLWRDSENRGYLNK